MICCSYTQKMFIDNEFCTLFKVIPDYKGKTVIVYRNDKSTFVTTTDDDNFYRYDNSVYDDWSYNGSGVVYDMAISYLTK